MTTVDASTSDRRWFHNPDDPSAMVSTAHKIALALTYAAAAATAWNGLKQGGFRIGDMLIGAALIAFLMADAGRTIPKLPGWVVQFGFIIVLIAAAHEIIPTDPQYLANRLVINGVLPVPGGIELESNLTVGIKFLVPVIFMPLVFAYARKHDKNAILRVAYAFAMGAAISGAVGLSDLLGITHISASLTGLPSVGGRAPGLTLHPNFLAMTSIIALPVMIWQLRSENKRTRVIALLFIVSLLLGLYASGSRAGFAVGPGAILLSVIIMPQYRRYLPSVILAVVGIAAGLFVLEPSLGKSLLQSFRLGGDTGSAQGSDQARAIIFTQGVNDFKHSPIDGVGLQVSEEAHNVYLQALAAGGVILLAGYLIFVFTGIYTVVKAMKFEPLAYPLFVSTVSGAIFVVVQAAFTDRVAYVSLALIATLPKGTAPEEGVSLEKQHWIGLQPRLR
jgi:O-antigen ligase